MGLISYIRDLYYDNKLKKADLLLDDGRTSEAEDAYLAIIDKHPQAACKLAEYYLSLSSSATVLNDISLFNKTFELKSNSANVYDSTSFEPLLTRFVKHIQDRANRCFESGQYRDCLSLTLALKKTKTNTPDDSILDAEAQIRLQYNDFGTTKVTDNTFNTLIDRFRKEWKICKRKKRAKDSALQFCQSLINARRYYASNLLLSIIQDNSYDSLCLDNATYVINGNDSEATPGIIKTVASSYAKSLVLRKGKSLAESVTIFKACWNATKDNALVMDILRSVSNTALKDTLVSEILQNHKAYFSSPSFLKDFSKWLYDSFEGEQSLSLLEKLHCQGYDVEEYFTQKVHICISKLSF